MKKAAAVVVVFLALSAAAEAQNFSRVIRMQPKRMNGPDVTRLQQRLLSLGFKRTGPADSWYGPLTEGSVKTVQYYMGFSEDGRVTKAFWDVLFDPKNDGLLRNIAIIANYAPGSFVLTTRRIGTNSDFDEFIAGTLNNEVKNVLFRHINEGLIIFRFRIWYLADAVFMIQDVYYGDYRTRVYVKTAGDFSEIRNGAQNPADPAMEGILNRVKEGVSAAGLTVPTLIPASLPADNQSKAPQPAAPAAQPAAPQTQPAAPAAQPTAPQTQPAAPGTQTAPQTQAAPPAQEQR